MLVPAAFAVPSAVVVRAAVRFSQTLQQRAPGCNHHLQAKFLKLTTLALEHWLPAFFDSNNKLVLMKSKIRAVGAAIRVSE
jgi:hypothetical protein